MKTCFKKKQAKQTLKSLPCISLTVNGHVCVSLTFLFWEIRHETAVKCETYVCHTLSHGIKTTRVFLLRMFTAKN
jgi:hypothetical protein